MAESDTAKARPLYEGGCDKSTERAMPTAYRQ